MRPPLKEKGGKDEEGRARGKEEESLLLPSLRTSELQGKQGGGTRESLGGEGVKDSPTLISLSLLALYKERGRGRFWVDSPTPKPTSPPQPS